MPALVGIGGMGQCILQQRDIVKLVCCKERGNSLMAKVINLIEGRIQEKKNNWRKTLTGRVIEMGV